MFVIKIILSLFLFCLSIEGENLYIYKESFKNLEVHNTKNNLNAFSTKQLGSFVSNDKTVFRLFAPNANLVKLFIFETPEGTPISINEMSVDSDGVWEITIDKDLSKKYYAFKVAHSENDDFEKLPLCIDPYSKAVTSFTDYYNPRKSIVVDEKYNWENDQWIKRDWQDLIIYEMHLRDMTAHPTANVEFSGTYKGLIEDGNAGINYIKELGVNTVEFLPLQEFGNMEAPFQVEQNGKINTWNPYERNHWGYMTAAFFAPSSYYSENWSKFEKNEWMGKDGRQIREFKDVVKAFHKEEIAVVMDVVFNHLSEYEIGNLKQIDREYYFRLNDDGSFVDESYCGNDLKTEAPMMRRLIIDSIIYWMKEYHIDGFRFDLGKLIDWETLEEIIREARKINPNVIFTAEPWGGGYDPKGFSLREWASWNDQIRNGIKGENPNDGLGWIFGNWYGNNSKDRLKSYINGTTTNFEHGLFQKAEHSVNYLESHDGYTLGDFIRIGSRAVNANDTIDTIENVDANAKLTSTQMKLNKLAALFLFTSQGITMIHSGQEFARSKVIPIDNEINDNDKGKLDHNSYNKDNYTNYINYKYAEINSNLLSYYKGLIELRNTYKEFRHANIEQIKFFDNLQNEFSIGFSIKMYDKEFIVLMNADQNNSDYFTLPDGEWQILVNGNKAGTNVLKTLSSKIEIPSISGLVLRKE
jgi:pullulanase/glycogen debranching enzyme